MNRLLYFPDFLHHVLPHYYDSRFRKHKDIGAMKQVDTAKFIKFRVIENGRISYFVLYAICLFIFLQQVVFFDNLEFFIRNRECSATCSQTVFARS